MKAIIIDDEQHCIDRLTAILHEYCSEGIVIAGAFQSIDDGWAGIKKLQPDVIFLDVQVHDKTGFDLLEKFDETNFDIIFTTAYDKYAVQAFKFSALDYLLKPVDPDDLLQAVGKLEGKRSKNASARKIEVLLHNVNALQGVSKRISIPTVNGFVFLNIADIVRCESHINYTTIHQKNGEKHTVAKTLKEFEDILGDFNFHRVHNSHLVNLAYLKSYNKGKGGYICLADNTEIAVSSRRKEGFLKTLSKSWL